MAVDNRADVSEALAALSRAGRSLAVGASLDPILAELADAAACAARAPTSRQSGCRTATARSSPVRCRPRPAHARPSWRARARARRRARGSSCALASRASAECLSVQIDAADGGWAARARPATGRPSSARRPQIAVLAADLAGLATRLCDGRAGAAGESAAPLDLAGDALAAAVDDERASARVARLAVAASGAESALVWRLHDGKLVLDGAHGPIEPDERLERAARAIVDEQRAVAVHGDRRARGDRDPAARPAAARRAAAPLRPGPGSGRGRPRPPRELRGPRCARAPGVRARPRGRLRARAEPRPARRRRRGDLSPVARRTRSRPPSSGSRSMLGRDRVAVYLREDGRIAVAASRGRRGAARSGRGGVARRGARLAPGRQRGRGRRTLATDERLEPARAQVAESGIDTALALPLVVGGRADRARSPSTRAGRVRSSADEPALLAALAAQLAVAVQNARLHERGDALGNRARKAALDAEQEKQRGVCMRSTRSRARSPTASRSRRRSTCSRSRS